MQVRTFEAATVKDAFKAIKKELGSEAVILSQKEKPTGFGNGKTVEVTVAVPDSNRGGATSRPVATSYASDEDSVTAGRVSNIELKLSSLADTLATRSQIYSIETGVKEIRALLLDALRGQDGDSIGNDLPVAVGDLYRQLRASGIDDVYLANLVKNLLSQPLPNDHSPEALAEFYKSHAIRWMIKRIKIAPRVTNLPGTVAVHGFMGPAGSGKSSLIAKLASQFRTKEKQKVLIVSFDNARLAGSEQLRTYAKIAGVPFTSITHPEELSSRISQGQASGGLDVVLIDTAGKSIKHADSLDDLLALKNCTVPVDLHLTLPITEKSEQHDRAIQYFAKAGIQSLAFSKMDESWSFGEIFNMSQRWSLPLSYFSMGPKIPDDVERATRERVAERIFGL